MSKIICHDYYGNVVTSLTQWDTNRILKIYNWQYDVSPIIQWTNRSNTDSYEVESILNQDGTVTFEVPNALLQNTETAIVFIGVARNGENGSSDIENATVFKVEFPIQRRTKPSGYVYSDNATVVDIVALKEVLENQIEAKIDSTRTDLSAEITSALHTTLDSVKDGAPKAAFETQEDLVGKEPGIYLYHPPLGSTDPYDGYLFYWDGEKISEPLISYGGKDSQANIAVTLIKPSTGEQFLKITVTDKDGNENIITTDNLNGKDSEGIKKIIYNGSELAVSDDKTVEFNAQPYIKELAFINDESEIEKLTIGKLYIVTKEMNVDGFTYYPGSLIMKTNHGIAGICDFGFILNGEFSPVWSEIQEGIIFKKTPSGYEVSIDGKKTELILPTKTSDLQNDSNFVSDENYVHTDNNFTTAEKTKLSSLENKGTTNYIELENKPSINGVELIGNKTSEELQINQMNEFDGSKTSSSNWVMLADMPLGVFKVINGTLYIKNAANYKFALSNGAIGTININSSGEHQLSAQLGSSFISVKDNANTASVYATTAQLAEKQDKLSTAQLNNISAIPNKIDKSQVGNGLKFADGMLQLDIPVATASTTYGGDTQ